MLLSSKIKHLSPNNLRCLLQVIHTSLTINLRPMRTLKSHLKKNKMLKRCCTKSSWWLRTILISPKKSWQRMVTIKVRSNLSLYMKANKDKMTMPLFFKQTKFFLWSRFKTIQFKSIKMVRWKLLTEDSSKRYQRKKVLV